MSETNKYFMFVCFLAAKVRIKCQSPTLASVFLARKEMNESTRLVSSKEIRRVQDSICLMFVPIRNAVLP